MLLQFQVFYFPSHLGQERVNLPLLHVKVQAAWRY